MKLNRLEHIFFKMKALLLVIVFTSIDIFASEFITKETLFNKVSFVIQDQDSILNVEYKRIKEIYNSQEYVKGLEKAYELYDKSRKEKNIRIEILTSILIGDIYDKTNDYRKSLSFHKMSIRLLSNTLLDSKLNNESNIQYAWSLLKIGAAYQKLNIKDSAKFFYKKLESLNSLNNEVSGFKATSYANLSGIYQQDSLFDLAEVFAEKAINIHKKRNDKINQAAALGNLASLYLSQGQYEKSKQYYFDGINLIEKDNSAKGIRYKASLYYNLAWAMRNLEEFEAYDYQEKYYDIEDGIRDKEIQTMVETVTAKYNVNTVRQQEELKRQKAQRNTWILGVSSFFIIVLLVFLLNQYKLRQKNLGLELSKQELQQQQKLEKIKSESQVRILNATLDGKETERKQIAETLHDSVSALLSSANLHLQACKKQFNGSTPVEVDKSQSIINEASQKIRDLSHTLVSSILLKFGLSYAIKDLTEKFSNSQLTIESETKYIKRYDQGFEIKLYNIIQEFINNILKHSEANYAKIMLIEKNKKLILTIEDNGKGFDKTLIPEKDGLGINQIDARIQMMQGKFLIESGKGKGTVINIELPIFEKKLAAIS